MPTHQNILNIDPTESFEVVSNPDILTLSANLAHQISAHTQLKANELLKIIQNMQNANNLDQS